MVSLEDFNKLAQHARGQEDVLRVMRLNFDEVGLKLMRLETEKKVKHGHINFGKELCPGAYDGKDAGSFKTWKVKVSNYLGSDDNDMVEELLDWAGKHKDKPTINEFDEKPAEEC